MPVNFLGSTSGYTQIAAAAVAGNNTLTLPTTTGNLLADNGSGSLSLSGNLAFTGTGNRITGDFSNATYANRVMFQNSVTNGRTNISALPNGTSTTAGIDLYGSSSDPANTSLFRIANTNAEYQFEGTKLGTGSYLPLTMYTGGSERLRIDTSGNVGIGTSSAATILQVSKASTSTTVGSSTAVISVVNSQSSALGETSGIEFFNRNASGSAKLAGVYGLYEAYNITGYAGSLVFATESSGSSNVTEQMRINSSGNVGIGTVSPGAKLDVVGASTTDIFHVSNSTSYFTVGVTAGTGAAVNAYQNPGGPLTLQMQTAGGTTTFGGNIQVGGTTVGNTTGYVNSRTNARAWVNFNGVTTATVRGSYNVSSVTRNATGDYTLNFTTALADANYAAVISTSGGATNGITGAVKASTYNGTLTNMTTTALSVYAYNTNANYDVTLMSVIIFGN